MRGEWSEAPGVDCESVLLFLHGGGYVSGSLESHRHLVAEAGRQAGLRTFAPEYRLAPEHPFPAALDDAVEAYRFLLAEGFSPERIVVAGDSAGGGLAISALLAIRDAGLVQPACAWCISPWVDLALTGESMDGKAASDPIIARANLEELAALYLNGANTDTSLASPIHGDLAGLPPLLIQVGSAETLLDDSVRLARRAGAADVRVQLEVWPGMIHVWHLFHPDLTVGQEALAQAGWFIQSILNADAAKMRYPVTRPTG